MAKRRMNKQDKFKRILHDLEMAKRARKNDGHERLWARMLDMYQGKQFPEGMTEDDLIAVNIMFSTINVIWPSISLNHPKISLTAQRPEFEDQAIIAEQVLNYQWKTGDFQEPFRAAVKDYLIFGHGWVKVGWDFKSAERELTDEEKMTEFAKQVQEVDAAAAANPELAGELPTDEEIWASISSGKASEILEDRPFISRVSPFDMFVDPEATSMGDARWVAQRVVRSVEEVKGDPRYSPSVRAKVKPTMQLPREWEPESRTRAQRTLDRVVVWEFWDIRRQQLSVFADGDSDFLISPGPFPFHAGHPFEMIRNYEVPDRFYPMGDLDQLESLQDELNLTRTQMVNWRRKESRAYVYHESAFNDRGLEQLQSNEDNRMIPVQDEMKSLGEVIMPLPQTPMNPQLYDHSDLIQNDMNLTSGLSEYARGALPEIRRTATEAAIIQDSANARASDKLAQVEQFLSHVARKLMGVLQQFMTGPQVALVVGAQAQQLWIEFDREDIQGEFAYLVEGGSTQPKNETVKRQQALALFQAMMPFVSLGVVDPYALVEKILRDGFGERSPQKFLMDPAAAAEILQMQTMGGAAQDEAPQGQGVDAPQPPVEEGSQIAGVPPEVMAQLAGQVGLA